MIDTRCVFQIFLYIERERERERRGEREKRAGERERGGEREKALVFMV